MELICGHANRCCLTRIVSKSGDKPASVTGPTNGCFLGLPTKSGQASAGHKQPFMFPDISVLLPEFTGARSEAVGAN